MFVYTGYLDESGTHDGSPLTVMGGLLGRVEQWKEFEKQFSQLQTDYGFRVWHTKKFKRKAGDFQGWTDEKCHDLYWALQKVAGIGLTDAVATTLNNASYDADYKFGFVPKKARFDTKYGLCFRVCLIHFVQEVLKRKRRDRIPPLHIVLEAGHANCGDAQRIFLDEKSRYERAGLPVLHTLTVADKDDCTQLMMADFAAHTEYIREKRGIDTGLPRNRPTVAVPKGTTGSTHIQFTPEMLRKWRAEIIERAMPKKGPNTSLQRD